jgi:hypothetical protein
MTSGSRLVLAALCGLAAFVASPAAAQAQQRLLAGPQ